MIKTEMTADDLRAEIARRRLHIYKLAAAVGINPNRLGAMLNGRISLNEAIAEKLVKALEI